VALLRCVAGTVGVGAAAREWNAMASILLTAVRVAVSGVRA
jgi:hypothetical protein